MNCRHCRTRLSHVFLDLGEMPPSNAYLTAANLKKKETCYPLRLFVCDRCWLVQTEDFARAEELFQADYAYFSSTSKTWLDHATRYSHDIIDRLQLIRHSFVIEIAANDGYLLRNFVAAGIPCLGIEPTASTAAAAEKLGIPILHEFFGEALAQRLAAEGRVADLIIGNNVYAHVPDINDFTRGLKTVLAPGGTITLEFPHLARLIEGNQFDTVYHEHFSYLSLYTVYRIFAQADLRVFDVEELCTHGGSLRVYGCHDADVRTASSKVAEVLKKEKKQGLQKLETYRKFQTYADKTCDDLLAFLKKQKRAKKTVAAYGAAAKGNTLLNYAGVTFKMISFVCDAAPSKQGKFLPGSHIPILAPEVIKEKRPDYVLILPWNIAPEVAAQHSYIESWGGEFMVAIPKLSRYSPAVTKKQSA